MGGVSSSKIKIIFVKKQRCEYKENENGEKRRASTKDGLGLSRMSDAQSWGQ